MGKEPPQPHAVDRDAVVGAGARALDRLRVGDVAFERPAVAPLDHAARGGDRRARWRVDLLVVVQLDDLRRLEEARGDLRHVHHQHRADGEVRGDQSAELPLRASLREILDERLRQTRRADDEAHAALERHIGEDGGPGGVREVDDDVGLRLFERGRGVRYQRDRAAGWEREQRRRGQPIDDADGSEGRIGVHGVDDCAAHLAGAGDEYADRCGHAQRVPGIGSWRGRMEVGEWRVRGCGAVGAMQGCA